MNLQSCSFYCVELQQSSTTIKDTVCNCLHPLMVTFPEAVKSVACAHDEGVFTGTVDWNCVVSSCVTCIAQRAFYVVGSEASVVYINLYKGRYCIAGTFGGNFTWRMPTFFIGQVLYLADFCLKTIIQSYKTIMHKS